MASLLTPLSGGRRTAAVICATYKKLSSQHNFTHDHRFFSTSIVSAVGESDGQLDRWSVSGMVSSNKGDDEHLDNGLDERESKRVKIDAPVVTQEKIVKVSGFGNRALRSVLKGTHLSRDLKIRTVCLERQTISTLVIQDYRF